MNDDVFVLVDCNSFYCSCERLFNPHLINQPVIVLSNNDGCAVSLTPEAKKVGIKMGDPYFKIKNLIEKNNVAVFSSNYTLYADLSARVMQTLIDFDFDLEIYSIDEAFLRIKAGNDVKKIAYKIKQTVQKNTGIPVSVGVAKTKTLAKVANQIAKKSTKANGVFVLDDSPLYESILKKMPVQEIWGVGRASSEKLNSHQILTAWDLMYASEKIIQRLLTVVGRRIQKELKGEPCLNLEQELPSKKGICSSRSFGRPVVSLKELKESVAEQVSIAAAKLRKQSSLCLTLQVFIRTNRFKQSSYANQSIKRLLSATDQTNKLIAIAHQALEEVFLPGHEYQKTGVYLTGIIPKGEWQPHLFEDINQKQKQEKWMQSIDEINQKVHTKAVWFASCGIKQEWKMRSNQLSKRYTTSWEEILEVK